MSVYKILAFLLMGLALGGCEKTPQDKANKPIIVILSPDNPPYEFKETSRSGEDVVGFDLDLVKEVARRLGRPLEIIEGDFNSLIPSLQSKRADMAISEMTPSEERRKNVLFSDAYSQNKMALLVPFSSSVTSERDLEGGKLGVQLGSVHEGLGKSWTQKISGLTVVSLSKIGELVQDLKNKRLQAVLMGGKVAQNIAKSTPGFRVILLNTSGEGLAIAFPKGSSLVEPINHVLKEMGPFIQKLEKKWLN